MKTIKHIRKRIVIFMGIIAVLAGLLGCKADTEPVDEFTGIVDLSDVSVEESEKVIGCEFGISGYVPGFEYRIYQSEDHPDVTLLDFKSRENGLKEGTCEVDSETLSELSKLCKKLSLRSWDGFNKSAKGVLDGSGFSLSMDFADGTHIKASGSNRFPKNYNSFESTFLNILAPVIEKELVIQLEEKHDTGAFSENLEIAMVNFKGRGASGSDDYSFLIRDSSSSSTKADITVTSVSGEFIEPGSYRIHSDPDNTDELLSEIQSVLEKYDVYKWDGYDKSTEDYNDREWFQLDFCYPNAQISCCGCGDTEHYSEVREELLTILIKYLQEYLESEGTP